jgi:phage-related minor tail protein
MVSIGSSLEESFGSFFDVTSDKFASLKALGLDMANSIYKALIRNYVIGQAASSTSNGSGIVGMITSNFFADGGVISSPSLSNYSNSVVSKPTPFMFATGGVPNLGIMGEAGSEAILPLTRTASGDLGVKAVSGQNQNITIAIKNESGQQLGVTSSNIQEDMSGMIINVVIDALNTNKGGLRTAMGA